MHISDKDLTPMSVTIFFNDLLSIVDTDAVKQVVEHIVYANSGAIGLLDIVNGLLATKNGSYVKAVYNEDDSISHFELCNKAASKQPVDYTKIDSDYRNRSLKTIK